MDRVIPYGYYNTSNIIQSFIEYANMTEEEIFVKGVGDKAFLYNGYKEGIRFLNKLYNEGLLDSEFALNDSSSNEERVMRGQVGVWGSNFDSPIRTSPGVYNQLTENVPDAEIAVLDCFINVADGTHLRTKYHPYGIYNFVPASSQNVEGAVKYNDISLQNIAFIVTEPDAVDMNGWHMSLAGTQYSFQWFKEITEPELWLFVDEGEWKNMASLRVEDIWGNSYPSDQWKPFEFYKGRYDTAYRDMYLYEEMFPEGHVYEFAICYENDGVSVNNFVMDLRDGRHLSVNHDGGGPRGGDDREELEPPPIDPPPVDPPPVDPTPTTPGGGIGTDSGSDQPDRRTRGTPSGSAESPSTPPNPSVTVAEAGVRLESPTGAGMENPESLQTDNDVLGTAQPVPPVSAPEAHTTPDATRSDETDEAAETQPPDAASSARNTVPVVAATALSAAGAIILWKLFGKRLVKPQ